MFLFSLYIVASHSLGKAEGFHLSPQAGVRGLIHTLWANAAAPQFGLTAGYKSTEIYGNYVLGYVYPATTYNNVDEDLKSVDPEVMYHYEVGIRHDFKSLASIGDSFFYDDGRNRIISNPERPRELKNASLIFYFRITGVEWYGNIKPMDDLLFLAGGTWMSAKFHGEDGVVANKMPFTPELSLSAGFTWRPNCFWTASLDGLLLSGDYQYLSGVYTYIVWAGMNNHDGNLEDQHLVHLRVSYNLEYRKWRIQKAEAFINIDNLLNRRYEYWPGYPMPGITVMAGVNITLN